MLVMEAARHAAAQLQPVLLDLPHACLLCLAGRSALPLDRGTADTVACQQAARGKRWSQRSRPVWIRLPSGLGSGAGLVGGACGWGSGISVPAGQIPPPWAWWENEAPTTSCLQLLPGCLVRTNANR